MCSPRSGYDPAGRPDLTWDAEREALLAAARSMSDRGLVAGTSGNVSSRLPGSLYLVTPTSLPYETMTVEDLEPVDGEGVPSTESQLHLAIYHARADVSAIAHTHSVHASAAAAAGIPLPPILDEVVVQLGGAIECAAYAPPASEELAANAVQSLGGRRAVLLRNHGVAAVGRTPRDAVEACALVERLAQVFFLAKLAGGPVPLPPEVIEAETAIYRMRQAHDN
jgi:L-fuculose-phosphate aldolase